jgi:thiopeptide-type bacteriocin biosynthesis protein
MSTSDPVRVDEYPWRQVNVAFADQAAAEDIAVAQLGPLLTAAEDQGLLESWFFVRKAASWRVRYLPDGNSSQAGAQVTDGLRALRRKGHIDDVTEVVYEPEVHAFGGTEGMAVTHRLFHADSRNLLAQLAGTERQWLTLHRRETAVLLNAALLRAACLDWFEQGDVWARVASHRERPEALATGEADVLHASLRVLMSADTTMVTDSRPHHGITPAWVSVFSASGDELAKLAAAGLLHRGLRAVLAHHVIFAWNRHGLPHAVQARLSNAAAAVVFGPRPGKGMSTNEGAEPWSGS